MGTTPAGYRRRGRVTPGARAAPATADLGDPRRAGREIEDDEPKARAITLGAKQRWAIHPPGRGPHVAWHPACDHAFDAEAQKGEPRPSEEVDGRGSCRWRQALPLSPRFREGLPCKTVFAGDLATSLATNAAVDWTAEMWCGLSTDQSSQSRRRVDRTPRLALVLAASSLGRSSSGFSGESDVDLPNDVDAPEDSIVLRSARTPDRWGKAGKKVRDRSRRV
jgi:hypothetical protein